MTAEFTEFRPQEISLTWWGALMTIWSYVYVFTLALFKETVWHLQSLLHIEPGYTFRRRRRPGYEAVFIEHGYGSLADCWNRPISSSPGAYVKVVKRERKSQTFFQPLKPLTLTDEEVLSTNLASYNYLGFGGVDNFCTEFVANCIAGPCGFSTCAARGGHAGTRRIHLELEAKIADFLGKEDALVYGMGFATNSIHIPALVDPEGNGKDCLILSDILNHRSIVEGVRMSGVTVRAFKHNDMVDLEDKLKTACGETSSAACSTKTCSSSTSSSSSSSWSSSSATRRPPGGELEDDSSSAASRSTSESTCRWRKIIVIVEGIYSMEGDFCRLRETVALKNKYGAYLYLDEAHSIGAVGKSGRGVSELLNVPTGKVDVMMGTFTKSFGSAGGYIAGDKAVIDALRKNAASSGFSVSMSPACAAQAYAALHVIQMDPVKGAAKLKSIRENSNYFRDELQKMGYCVLGDVDSPVIPVLMDPLGMLELSKSCLDLGVAIVVVGYPATPFLLNRARFCISAAHTREQLQEVLGILRQQGERLGILYCKSNPKKTDWRYYRYIRECKLEVAPYEKRPVFEKLASRALQAQPEGSTRSTSGAVAAPSYATSNKMQVGLTTFGSSSSSTSSSSNIKGMVLQETGAPKTLTSTTSPAESTISLENQENMFPGGKVQGSASARSTTASTISSRRTSSSTDSNMQQHLRRRRGAGTRGEASCSRVDDSLLVPVEDPALERAAIEGEAEEASSRGDHEEGENDRSGPPENEDLHQHSHSEDEEDDTHTGSSEIDASRVPSHPETPDDETDSRTNSKLADGTSEIEEVEDPTHVDGPGTTSHAGGSSSAVCTSSSAAAGSSSTSSLSTSSCSKSSTGSGPGSSTASLSTTGTMEEQLLVGTSSASSSSSSARGNKQCSLVNKEAAARLWAGVSRDTIDRHGFCMLDPLGLATSPPPDLPQVCNEYLWRNGFGACGPRGFYGGTTEHLLLEQRLASFFKKEECVLYSHSVTVASSVFASMIMGSDHVFCHEAANFGIRAGLRLNRSGFKLSFFRDLDHLEELLRATAAPSFSRPSKQEQATQYYVVAESLSSSDGTVLDLPRLIEMKKRHGLLIALDESMSFAALGPRGLVDHFNVPVTEVDVVMASLEYGIGGIGGFCATSHALIRDLRLTSSGYCFSASAPGVSCKWGLEVLQRLENDEFRPRLENLRKNTDLVLSKLQSEVPELQVTGDSYLLFLRPRGAASSTYKSLRRLQKAGERQGIVLDLWHRGAVEKALAKRFHLPEEPDEAALRLCVSSLHTEKDLCECVAKLKNAVNHVL